MRNGQILEGPDAIKPAEAVGWDKFPSYANHDAGEARYGQMHDFMDKDAQAYFADRPGQGRQIQMTPQIGKTRSRRPHHRGTPAANGSRQ